MSTDNQAFAAGLVTAQQQIENDCSRCQLCVAECRFLAKYGDPKQIAEQLDPSDSSSLQLAYECSLCGLCQAVCPDRLAPQNLFLEMRREAVRSDSVSLSPYKGLLAYERKGSSRHFSWYGLPEGCETVFFPGCALTGSRPQQTQQAFSSLQQQIPQLGIVLDCCTKPSHDLGRQDYFLSTFGELKNFLLQQGVKQVLVACPNCYQVFSGYATELEIRSIYELLQPQLRLPGEQTPVPVHIHDPCVTRFAAPLQQAVRGLVEQLGLPLVETAHSGEKTHCCGEGGAVACRTPELADEWRENWSNGVTAERTLTYCAGCAQRLNKRTPTSHILDLLYAPADTLQGKAKVGQPPLTYLNRLRLKKQLQNSLPVAVSHERGSSSKNPPKSIWRKKRFLAAAVIVAILFWRFTGLL